MAGEPTKKDDKNFFDSPVFDWEAYLKYRPVYSPEFYKLIVDYHRSKSNAQFDLAHDVGTGPGQTAEEIAKYFTHVIASDASEPYTNVARQRLEQALPGKITVVQCPVEQLASEFPTGSADLITAAECLPLMDWRGAFQSFSYLLKPGGTLAIWFYGRPFFTDPKLARAQELYEKISTTTFRTFEPFRRGTMNDAWTILASRFDLVNFPEAEWASVQRTKWNPDREMPFLPIAELGFEPRWTSEIREDEEVKEVHDLEWWGKQGGVEFIRGFVGANMPWKGNHESEEVKGWYRELEKELGGKEHAVSWPVVLLLATKK